MSRHDNVRPIPVRQDMPPEIAAVALPREEGQPPIVILNTAESDPRTAFSLLRDALAAGVGLLLGARTRRWIRKHQVAATAITTVALSSTAFAAVNVALDKGGAPATRPPISVTATATSPPATSEHPLPAATAPPPTATPRKTPERARPSRTVPPQVRTTRRPAPSASHHARPADTPSRSRQPKPVASSTPPPKASPAAIAETDPPRGLEPPPPTPRHELERTLKEETSPLPSSSSETLDSPPAGKACTIEVDLDPVLDVCVIL